MKKKILALLLCVAMIASTFTFAIPASAATSGSCGDNVTWTFDEATGTLTISGIGDMYDYSEPYSNNEVPWNDYCSEITSILISEGITSISDWAFYDCEYLTEITIPDSVTSIGNYAFKNCDSLVEITIPNSVISIPDYAFYY